MLSSPGSFPMGIPRHCAIPGKATPPGFDRAVADSTTTLHRQVPVLAGQMSASGSGADAALRCRAAAWSADSGGRSADQTPHATVVAFHRMWRVVWP